MMVSIIDFVGPLHERIVQAADALGSAGGDIIFPAGRYRFARELTLTGRTHIRFVGEGAIVDGMAARAYFNFEDCTDISFEGFNFDARFGELAPYANFSEGVRQVPIRFMNGQGLAVSRCKFARLYTVFIYAYGSSNIDIRNSEFSSLLQNQDQYLSFVEFLTCGGTLNVASNFFCGSPTRVNDKSPAAVAASGISGDLTITDNRIQHCGRNNGGAHRLACFDLYADTVNVTVRGNTALNCREQFMRISTSVDVTVDKNFVSIAPEVDSLYSTLSVESGSWPDVAHPVCRNVVISNNSFRCAGNRQAFAIGVTSYDWGAAVEDIRIEMNAIEGYDRAIVVAGPFRGINIIGNRVREVRSFLDVIQSGTVPMTSILGDERSSFFGDLLAQDNEIEIAEGSNIVPVSFSIGQARRYSGSVGAFSFRRNRLSGLPMGTAVAVNCLFNAAVAQGVFDARDNLFRGYATPFYLRSVKRATIEDNVVEGMAELYVTDGTVQSLGARRNHGRTAN